MKTGVPTSFRSLFFGIKGYDQLMKTFNHLTAFDSSQIARLRLEAIEFYDKYGLAATLSAYKISKSSLFRWRKQYLEAQKRLTALIPQSTRPKTVRQRLVNPRITAFIKEARLSYGPLGKDKLKPLLDEFCLQQGLGLISASTIGRIIADHHGFYQRKNTGKVYHNPSHGWAKQRKNIKRLRQKYAPKPKSFGHMEMDTLVKFVDGLKVYLRVIPLISH